MNASYALGSAISGSRTAQFGLWVLLLAALVGCASPSQTDNRAASTDVSSLALTPNKIRGWLQTIPADVNIATNIHAGRDSAIAKQSPTVHRASLLGISCPNPPSLDTGRLDRLGVDAPDYPGDSRTLYLYSDGASAKHQFRLIRTWLADCNGTEECCTTHLRPSRLGDNALLEVTTDVGTGAGPTGRWLRLIRVGNALLLTDTNDGSSLGPALEQDVRRQRADLKPVLSDMEVFAAPKRRTQVG